MRPELPPVRHPLAALFQQAADSLTTSLTVESRSYYHATLRHFLNYLGTKHPPVRFLRQLRRTPHIVDWLALLRSRQPALAKVTHAHHVIRLRRMLEELAWTQAILELTHLVRPDDIPRPDQYLPRPLTAEQDQLIQRELLRRDDRDSNVFLLLRHTGLRIGECIDLSWDCLRSIGQDQWALHVPLGKLQTERLVPVDGFVCQLVHPLRELRSQDPLPADGLLLARPRGRYRLGRHLRASLREIAASVGITSHIVPHQFRHSFGTEMLRAGVSFPAVMRMLGHKTPHMTLRYLEVSTQDLQREFYLAFSDRAISYRHQTSHPRSVLPSPAWPTYSNPSSWLSTLWKCSAVLSSTDHIVVSSIGSPTGLPRSAPKHENSASYRTGHRLAG